MRTALNHGTDLLDASSLNTSSSASNDNDHLILVDGDDVPQGVAPKMEVHRRGLKHRAISALVRNRAGEMLLHQRNAVKYHSGGLWTNACCSHPRPGETTPDAAHRRLAEEMGIHCALRPLFIARYRAAVSNDYIEDEVVHVFGGTYDGEVRPDPGEVADFRWVALDALIDDLARNPQRYTVWFHHYLGQHIGEIRAWMERG
jgi:isopentenyl-diphosphate delta-isomerase